LLNCGLIKRKVEAVKILGKGDIEHALSVKVGLISKGARDKIIAAGGSIVEVN
jgi:large subunit ribosomal protein L15